MSRTNLAVLIFAGSCTLSTLPALAQSAKVLSQEQWPQSFALHGNDVRSYGFAVTQPGSVALQVKAQGAPVDVILLGPAGPPFEQQGSGEVRIQATASLQDVQRGVFWQVLIRLTPPAAQAGAQSGGSIAVQHPPADQRMVQQAVAALQAQRRDPKDPQFAQAAAASRAKRDAIFSARLAAAEQELVQRRTGISQTLQPTVEAMQRQKAAAMPKQPIYKPPAAVHPVITSLSAAAGVPGDGLMINGSGFGATNGEVHFLIGPSFDKTSAPAVWVDGQIFVAVPDPSVPDPSVGAPAYDGVVYVVAAGVKSNLVPFHFAPIIDHRRIRIPADYLLGNWGENGLQHDATGQWAIMWRFNNNWLTGASGDDQYFRNTLLQNGWTVESQPIAYNDDRTATGGGISTVTARVGTSSPYMDVFSYIYTEFNSGGVFSYQIEIPIQGPRGLPDGIVCVTRPAPNNACPNSQ